MLPLRRKHAISPLRPSTPAPIAYRPPATSPTYSLLPVAYVLEWSLGSVCRRDLATAEALRTELTRDHDHTQQRLLVVRRAIPESQTEKRPTEFEDVLIEVADVDRGFLQGHRRSRTNLARQHGGRKPCWSWKYLDSMLHGSPTSRSHLVDDRLVIVTASLWLGSRASILLLDTDVSTAYPHMVQRPPTLQHQEASTKMGRLYQTPGTSTGGEQHIGFCELENDLTRLFDEDTEIEEVLGEWIYEKWIDFLDTLTIHAEPTSMRQADDLNAAMRALEYNIDMTSILDSVVVTSSDWSSLLDRLLRRIDLCLLATTSCKPIYRHQVPCNTHSDPTRPPTLPPPNKLKERSLDRIAYLGGLLLPISVISGIVSIQGPYGPDGRKFWVFWAASVGLTLVALLVIYLDQVRGAEVWMEVAADKILDGYDLKDLLDGSDDSDDGKLKDEGGGSVYETGLGGLGTYLIERGGDGLTLRTWERKELGWKGAVGRVTGYDLLKRRKKQKGQDKGSAGMV